MAIKMKDDTLFTVVVFTDAEEVITTFTGLFNECKKYLKINKNLIEKGHLNFDIRYQSGRSASYVLNL